MIVYNCDIGLTRQLLGFCLLAGIRGCCLRCLFSILPVTNNVLRMRQRCS